MKFEVVNAQTYAGYVVHVGSISSTAGAIKVPCIISLFCICTAFSVVLTFSFSICGSEYACLCIVTVYLRRYR